MLNIVTGAADDAPAIGQVLTTDPRVRKVSFTGSTEVGKILMRQSSSTLKRLSLELGGNAPFIVFDDADLDAAVRGAMASKYRNAGQTCVCANRFYVQDAMYDRFATAFARATSQLRVGDGFDEGVQVGPLIDAAALAKVESHVADATARGARTLTGGTRDAHGGTFYTPTVMVDVPADALLAREETFGPVAGLVRFHTDEEAYRLANDTPYGLAAYVYSRDVGRLWRAAEALGLLVAEIIGPSGRVLELPLELRPARLPPASLQVSKHEPKRNIEVDAARRWRACKGRQGLAHGALRRVRGEERRGRSKARPRPFHRARSRHAALASSSSRPCSP